MLADIKSMDVWSYVRLFMCWTELFNTDVYIIYIQLVYMACCSLCVQVNNVCRSPDCLLVFKYTCLKIKCISFHFVPRRLSPFNSACIAAANLLLILKTRESQVGSRIQNSQSRQILDFLDFNLHVHVPLFSKPSGSVLTSQRLWFAVTKDPCCKIGSVNKFLNCRQNYEIL